MFSTLIDNWTAYLRCIRGVSCLSWRVYASSEIVSFARQSSTLAVNHRLCFGCERFALDSTKKTTRTVYNPYRTLNLAIAQSHTRAHLIHVSIVQHPAFLGYARVDRIVCVG